MGRLSKKQKMAAAVTLTPTFLVVALLVVCANGNDAMDWVTLRVFYRDYLAWKRNGGPIEPGFYEPLMLDRQRDDMVRDLHYDQILLKFPSLADGDRYSPTSYKGQYLKEARRASPEVRVL